MHEMSREIGDIENDIGFEDTCIEDCEDSLQGHRAERSRLRAELARARIDDFQTQWLGS